MPSIISPLADYRISSGVGTRAPPLPGASSNHQGLDMAAPIGTTIRAPTDLRIVTAHNSATGGNMVTATDAAGNKHRFLHMNNYSVSPGDVVSQGDVIGTVGSTGRSTGPHLHWDIKDKLGNVLDPKKLLAKAEDLGSKAISKGKDALKKAATVAALSNPATAPIAAAALAADALDGGEDCGLNPICHLKKWLKDSDFFPRFGLTIVGVILLIGAVVLLARGQLTRTLSKTIKG